MNRKNAIQIFGLRDESIAESGCDSSGSDGCSSCCGCGPAPTMGYLYQELVEIMEMSDIKDRITLQFIDVNEDNMDEYEAVKKLLDTGIVLPVTAIDGVPRFYGGLSVQMIYEAVTEMGGTEER